MSVGVHFNREVSRVTQESAWLITCDEMVVDIFSYLDPESLIRCQRTCLNWYQIGCDKQFYFEFAKKLQFFFRKDGPQYFKEESRSKFLADYRQIKTISLMKGETRFDAIQRLQKTSNKAIDLPLPPSDDFEDPFTNYSNAQFRVFDYSVHKASIVSFIFLGAYIENNTPDPRPFYLAAFNGDKATLSILLSQNTQDEKEKKTLLSSTALMAIVGGQTKIMSELKSCGVKFTHPIPFGYKLSEYVSAYGFTKAGEWLSQEENMN